MTGQESLNATQWLVIQRELVEKRQAGIKRIITELVHE